MSNEPVALRPYQMPELLREYLYRVAELGATEGPVGSQEQTPEIRELLTAMHHLMAGGRVKLSIELPGTPETVGELNSMLDRAPVAVSPAGEGNGP